MAAVAVEGWRSAHERLPFGSSLCGNTIHVVATCSSQSRLAAKLEPNLISSTLRPSRWSHWTKTRVFGRPLPALLAQSPARHARDDEMWRVFAEQRSARGDPDRHSRAILKHSLSLERKEFSPLVSLCQVLHQVGAKDSKVPHNAR